MIDYIIVKCVDLNCKDDLINLLKKRIFTEQVNLITGLTEYDLKIFFTILGKNNSLIKKIIDSQKNLDKTYKYQYKLIHLVCEYCELDVINYIIDTKKINLQNIINEEKIIKIVDIKYMCHKYKKLYNILKKKIFHLIIK